MLKDIEQLIAEVVKKSELESSYYRGAIEALNLLQDRVKDKANNEETTAQDNKPKRIPKPKS